MLERAKVLLGEGLLTSEGEFHTRQRRLVQAAFHRDRMAHYGGEMVACAAAVRDSWHTGMVFDLAAEMPRLTLAIVGRTLFSADISSEAEGIGRAMNEVLSLFDTLLMPFSDWLQTLPLPKPLTRRFEQAARDTLDKVIYGLIAERRASGQDKGDLLSMLLLAQDEDRDGMTDRQVRDEALTLLIAGHETTANALLWSWYLLSQNPDTEARLHAELNQVLEGRLPVFDDVMRLPLTAGVFSGSSAALSSPAWAIGRRARRELVTIGDLHHPGRLHSSDEPVGFPSRPALVSRPGEIRSVSLAIGLHREKLPKFAYFPFGGGARVCIGERFAWAEGVLVPLPTAGPTLEAASCARSECRNPRRDHAALAVSDEYDFRSLRPAVLTGNPV